jgi:regulatory protein
MELREKGLALDAIKEALAEIESEDELELAKEIALLKMAKTSGPDKATVERKVAGFLARKGYPSSVVWSAVRYASEQLSR